MPTVGFVKFIRVIRVQLLFRVDAIVARMERKEQIPRFARNDILMSNNA